MTKFFPKLLLLAVGLLAANLALAQLSVSGVVTGTDGEPLPGASIIIKDSNSGTVTDFDGSYTLNNVPEAATLTFSFLGFLTKEVEVNSSTTIDVVLEENSTALDEVVVVGYGTQSREALTTSVSSISSEDLVAIPVSSVERALEGRAAGVQVRAGGSAGERSSVSIRGLNTFGDGSPLFVVDGVFVGDLTEINPASIEKVDVLKDAAASAIYGSRGSNGVVIITTKGGKSGKAKLTLDMNTGFQYLPESKFYDVINSDQLINLLIEEDIRQTTPEGDFSGNDSPPRLLDSNFVAANTNWQDEIYQNAPMSRIDLGVSGGSDFVKYNFGVGYFDQQGIQIDTDFKRYSINLNTEYKISNRITVGQTLNAGYSNFRTPEMRGGQSLQEWAFRSLSYLPVQLADGRYVSANREDDAISIDAINPVIIAETQDNQTRRASILGSVYGEVELFRGLTNRLNYGVNYSNNNFNSQQDRFGEEFAVGSGLNPNKFLFKLRGQNLSTNLTNVLTYRKSFGEGTHNFDVSYIYERFDNTYEQFQTGARSATEDNSITQFANISGDNVTVQSFKLPEVLLSHAGRFNYNYQGKYILSGSVRRDATSKFSDPVGIFPAGSVAWVVSKEGFMKDSKINSLKLRASYGVTGNNRVPVFSNVAALNANFNADIGGELVMGIAPDGIDSPNLTWETSKKSNFGVDLAFVNNRLKISADYFTSKSEDLIVIPPTDISLGLARNPPVNSADIDSKGYEFTVGYGKWDGEFQWDIWSSLSVVRPEVKRIAEGVDAIPGVLLNSGGNTAFSNIIRVGAPLYGIVGFQTMGIFRTAEEVLLAPTQVQAYNEIGTGSTVTRTRGDDGAYIFTNGSGQVIDISQVELNTTAGTAPGDIRFVDLDGDGEITENDRTIIGDPNPDFTYSMNLNARYRALTLTCS